MIVALIPAKKHSSRLHNKNLKRLGKIPLFAHTINYAKKSKLLDDIYVSSDDKKILKNSEILGCKSILRPKSLSKKTSPMNLVIDHFIKFLQKKNIKFTGIVLLQPTSPFRPKKLLDKLIKIFKRRKSTIITVKKIDNEYLKGIIINKKKIRALNQKYFFQNTQDLPNFFMPNGSIYIFNNKKFILKKEIPIKKLFTWEMKSYYNIDINYIEDFKNAKKYVQNL